MRFFNRFLLLGSWTNLFLIGAVFFITPLALAQTMELHEWRARDEKQWWILIRGSDKYIRNDLQNVLLTITQAQQLAAKMKDENNLYYITPYRLIAQAYYSARDYQKAIIYAEEHNRRLKKMIKNTDSTQIINGQYSSGLHDLALIYNAANRIEDAEQACIECLKLNRYRYPEAIKNIYFQGPLKSYIDCKIQLADIYAAHNKQSESIPLYQEGIQLLKECYTNNPVWQQDQEIHLCRIFSNLGYVHNDMGNYHFAEIALKEACFYGKKALENGKKKQINLTGTKESYSTALINLARTLSELKQPIEAATYFKEAETIVSELNQPEDTGILKANMASLLYNLTVKERLEMRLQAIELYKKTTNLVKIQRIQEAVAQDLINLRDFSNAKKYLKEAGQLYNQLNHKPSRGQITALWSFLAIAQNKPRKALRLIEKAISEYPSYGSDYPQLWWHKVFVLTQLGKIEEADLAWMTTMKLMNQGVQTYFPYLSESQREQYVDNYDNYREQYLSFSCLSKRSVTTSGNLYDLALSSKGVLLETIRRVKENIATTTDTAFRKKQMRYFYTKRALARYYQSGQKEWMMNIDSLETETEALEKEISRTVLVRQRPDPTWQQVKATLKPNAAAVEIIRFRLWYAQPTRENLMGQWRDSVYYAALVITPTSKKPQLVLLPNGRALEGKHLRDYRNDIERRTYDADSYRWFWQPIQAALAQAKTIYFSPDGVYHQINLGTLRNSETGYFLSEKLDIHLVGSTRSLTDTLKTPIGLKTIALFGYPNYQQVSLIPKKDSLMSPTYYNLPDVERGNHHFQPLPGTKQEVESIQEIALKQGWKSQLFIEGHASEENVKQTENTTVLHIATHGYFLQDTSKTFLTKRALLNSGLVLAGAMDSTRSQHINIEDGVLTAYEVAGLTLKGTDLVTLSACETGLGLIRNGNGVFGLQRAFLAAGAASVLMSLWRVNDRVTKELMEKFYGYWMSGCTKQVALCKAQEDIRGLSEQFSHPYYWGGFVLTEP